MRSYGSTVGGKATEDLHNWENNLERQRYLGVLLSIADLSCRESFVDS